MCWERASTDAAGTVPLSGCEAQTYPAVGDAALLGLGGTGRKGLLRVSSPSLPASPPLLVHSLGLPGEAGFSPCHHPSRAAPGLALPAPFLSMH